MAMPRPAEEMIVANLIEALDRLREDLNKVELWAAALGEFRAPVPDYEPSERYRLRPVSDERPPNLRS
jgi:hypothetical protein